MDDQRIPPAGAPHTSVVRGALLTGLVTIGRALAGPQPGLPVAERNLPSLAEILRAAAWLAQRIDASAQPVRPPSEPFWAYPFAAHAGPDASASHAHSAFSPAYVPGLVPGPHDAGPLSGPRALVDVDVSLLARRMAHAAQTAVLAERPTESPVHVAYDPSTPPVRVLCSDPSALAFALLYILDDSARSARGGQVVTVRLDVRPAPSPTASSGARAHSESHTHSSAPHTGPRQVAEGAHHPQRDAGGSLPSQPTSSPDRGDPVEVILTTSISEGALREPDDKSFSDARYRSRIGAATAALVAPAGIGIASLSPASSLPRTDADEDEPLDPEQDPALFPATHEARMTLFGFSLPDPAPRRPEFLLRARSGVSSPHLSPASTASPYASPAFPAPSADGAPTRSAPSAPVSTSTSTPSAGDTSTPTRHVTQPSPGTGGTHSTTPLARPERPARRGPIPTLTDPSSANTNNASSTADTSRLERSKEAPPTLTPTNMPYNPMPPPPGAELLQLSSTTAHLSPRYPLLQLGAAPRSGPATPLREAVDYFGAAVPSASGTSAAGRAEAGSGSAPVAAGEPREGTKGTASVHQAIPLPSGAGTGAGTGMDSETGTATGMNAPPGVAEPDSFIGSSHVSQATSPHTPTTLPESAGRTGLVLQDQQGRPAGLFFSPGHVADLDESPLPAGAAGGTDWGGDLGADPGAEVGPETEPADANAIFGPLSDHGMDQGEDQIADSIPLAGAQSRSSSDAPHDTTDPEAAQHTTQSRPETPHVLAFGATPTARSTSDDPPHPTDIATSVEGPTKLPVELLPPKISQHKDEPTHIPTDADTLPGHGSAHVPPGQEEPKSLTSFERSAPEGTMPGPKRTSASLTLSHDGQPPLPQGDQPTMAAPSAPDLSPVQEMPSHYQTSRAPTNQAAGEGTREVVDSNASNGPESRSISSGSESAVRNDTTSTKKLTTFPAQASDSVLCSSSFGNAAANAAVDDDTNINVDGHANGNANDNDNVAATLAPIPIPTHTPANGPSSHQEPLHTAPAPSQPDTSTATIRPDNLTGEGTAPAPNPNSTSGKGKKAKPKSKDAKTSVKDSHKPGKPGKNSKTDQEPRDKKAKVALPPTKVLLVEDNYVNVLILSRLLTRNRIQFDVASNGMEAIAKWRDGSFHIIFVCFLPISL